VGWVSVAGDAALRLGPTLGCGDMSGKLSPSFFFLFSFSFSVWSFLFEFQLEFTFVFQILLI
jgi:hypothetical protein